MLDKLLQEAIRKGVSDIHITSDQNIRIRRNKKILKLDTFLSEAQVIDTAREVLGDRFDQFVKERQLDGSNEVHSVRYRYNVYYEKNKIAIAIRVISNDIKSIDELYLPDSLKNMITKPHGIILVTGPTGSGKSTTLAAMINEINETQNKHIVTIEDPIEYVFTDKKSIIHQREIGSDTLSFNDALRAVLRQDPDVIMLGELRDKETIEIALKASETGHLVLSTVHTSDAKSTINRLSGVFKGADEERIRYLLSDSLVSVVSQRLIPRADKQGIVGAFEVLINTSAISNLIKKGEIGQVDSYLKMGAKDGSISMADSLDKLIKNRVINIEDI